MNRLTRSLALLLASTWSTMLCAQAAPEPMRAETIHLYNGEVKILPVYNVRRVAVGNGKLLSVTNLPKQLIMIGTGVGDTNMLLWNKRGDVRAYNIDVSAENTPQVAANLRATLGGIPGLRIESRGGQVVLSGDITPEDAKRVAAVTQNLKSGVVNLTHAANVDMKRMVYLDVQVVDFKKSVLKNLGINWQQAMAGPALGVVGSAIDNPYYHIGDLTQGGQMSNQMVGPGGTLTGLPNQMPFSRYFGITTSLSSVINLAVQNGDAYIMANPQLSTRSGGDATFLAGGEVPIPVSSALGQTTVTYKNYGVQLNIKPVADRFGNIEASVDTEVSQIDPSVIVDGFPGFLTRKTSSVVNVKSGQTIVMSGLVQATGSNTLDKFPWLGDVPILGALFRDTNFQSSRDELVIFVTPEVINPDSPVNHEMINRGVHIARQFNASDMGKPVWMPGFGVGPGSHMPNPNPPKPVHGKVMPVSPPAPASTPAQTQPMAAPIVPAPAVTQPLQSAPKPAVPKPVHKPVWIIGKDNKQPMEPAPASSSGGGMTAVPVAIDAPRLTVSAPAADRLAAPELPAVRFAGPLHLHVAMAAVWLPITANAPRLAMLLPHVAPTSWSPIEQGHQLAVALLTPPKQPAVASIRQVLADLGLESEHMHPLRLLTLASTVYLPMPGAPIL
ncbi:MAG: pilus assembly protein N-terminal domain-containing protein [Metallibacterium scheffleri]|jgi:pilus assembly protein CpaC|uniref:type II and III secretion system protein family protein n=1 Tax=Metallibacterium scheffleri TaxID=993689 RepID=UPI0026EA14CB|nr:pilus assembly protein N-terminal domain-containing protein [Metallibacterium scheffleri]MCK9366888.1 pilus assembly protein N-terminal domain-containing protein [Metallibacterium scheffleri]